MQESRGIKIALIDAFSVVLLLTTAGTSMADGGCLPINIREFDGVPLGLGSQFRRPEINLSSPGSYCLDRPVHQRKLMERNNRRELTTVGGDGIVLIGADDVSLDLGGHLVSNERSLGYTLIKHYRYEPGRRHESWFVRTRVRNGSLKSPGSKGIGLRFVAANRYGPGGFGTVAKVGLGKSLTDLFIDTSHVVEGLQIDSGRRGILIDGRNNIIRNNHIIVDSATAIIAQGPGVVIEDNVIEVRNDLRGFSDYDRRNEALTPFPIRLIQADGAVIRNNRIRLVDRTTVTSLPAAIQLVESRDVTVHGNFFGGMDQPVLSDTVSSYSAIGNESDPCPGSAARYLPPNDSSSGVAPSAPACR